MPRNVGRAFTLIELLVVIAVIAMLIGILLPSLAGARRLARETMCQSNFRQYGLASHMYAGIYKEFIPNQGLADGYNSNKTIGGWGDNSFWANAVPMMLNSGGQTYYEMAKAHADGKAQVPSAGSKSVFVCPAAEPAAPSVNSFIEIFDDGHNKTWGVTPGYPLGGPTLALPTYWCYIANSGLDAPVKNGDLSEATAIPRGVREKDLIYFGVARLRLTEIRFPQMEIQMVEKLMTPREAPDANYTKHPEYLNCSKTKGNSAEACKLAGRHRKGGYVLFVDGHTMWMSRQDATSNPGPYNAYTNPGHWYWQPDY